MSAPEARLHARLFIALLVPDAIKDRIYAAQQELTKSGAEGVVRWTDRHQFHLTLRFLGNVMLDQTAALVESVTAACRGFGPLQMSARGTGFFPNSRRPRVIWVGVRDSGDTLADVQRAVQTASGEFTEEPPQKDFTGHITLGRFKTFDPRLCQGVVAGAEPMSQMDFGAWEAGELHVMQSRLSPRGATHSSLAAIPLRA